MDTQNQPDDLIVKIFGDHCLLCGAEPSCLRIFIPDKPIAWGGCKGKSQLVHDCLCSKCHGRQDTPERVEKIIQADLAGGVTHAE